MKVAAIIQARMGSTRLPGKVLMDLAGKPMLWHVVDRVKKSKTIDTIIVATSVNPEDDAVVDLCKKEGWLFSRGSSEDVLARYYNAAKEHEADTIVRLTSDCPLIDPKTIDACVGKFLQGKYDFLSNCEVDSSTFPRGLDVRVISFKALEEANQKARKPFEREHVWPYIPEQAHFAIGPVLLAGPEYRADYRLTVDYPEDMELMQKIYQNFYIPGAVVDVPSVLTFLKDHPDVANINANCKQKYFKA